MQKWDQISIGKATTTKQIADTIRWLHTYLTASSTYYIQGMQLLPSFLLNSAAPELQQSVICTLHSNDETH
eukprot:7116418-Ditylum_brightwellii.AAC.1